MRPFREIPDLENGWNIFIWILNHSPDLIYIYIYISSISGMDLIFLSYIMRRYRFRNERWRLKIWSQDSDLRIWIRVFIDLKMKYDQARALLPPLNWSNPFLNRSYLRPRDGYLKYMNRISLSGWKHDRFFGIKANPYKRSDKDRPFFPLDWEDGLGRWTGKIEYIFHISW